MAEMDRLFYFPVRARGEAIRMLYALSGTSFEDQRISLEEWPEHKPSKLTVGSATHVF